MLDVGRTFKLISLIFLTLNFSSYAKNTKSVKASKNIKSSHKAKVKKESIKNGEDHFEISYSLEQLEKNYQSGEQATLSGTICFNPSENKKGQKKCSAFPWREYDLKATFPDELSLRSDVMYSGKSELAFEFVTPSLDSTLAQEFTLSIVKKGEKETRKLLTLKSQTEHRIEAIDKKMAKYESEMQSLQSSKRLEEIESKIEQISQSSASQNWFKKSLNKFKNRSSLAQLERELEKELARLAKMIALLQEKIDALNIKKEEEISYIAKLDIYLENNPDLYAQLKLPLMIEGNSKGSFVSSYVANGFRLKVESDKSPKFQREAGKLTYSIIPVDINKTEENSKFEFLRMGFRGEVFKEVSLSEVFSASQGSPVSYSQDIDEMVLEDSAFMSMFKESGKSFKKSKKSKASKEKKLIEFESIIPVLLDSNAPVISIAELSGEYLGQWPQLSGAISDNGRLDLDSLVFSLNGVDITDSVTIETESNSLINFSYSKDDSELETLEDGQYKLSVSASDVSKNESSSEIAFFLDRTAPVISSSSTGNIQTNSSQFELSFSVSDTSAISYKLMRNNVLLVEGEGSEFSQTVELLEGENDFVFTAIDQVGNSSEFFIENITLDSTPPELALSSPVAGSFSASNAVSISGNSNEELSKVLVNGVAATLSDDKLSFSLVFSDVADGLVTYSVVGEDLAGNASTLNTSLTIDTVAPEIALSGEEGIYTNLKSYTFSYEVSDANSVENSVLVNGQLQSSFSEKSGSVTLNLSEGTNSVSFKSTDAAGNTSTKELSEIILDQTAPALSLSAPTEGGLFNEKEIIVSGTANEALKSVAINGAEAAVSEDGLSFSLTISAESEGEFSIDVVAFDLAGNSSELNRSIFIDTIAPSLSLSSPVEGSLSSSKNVSLVGSSNEALKSVFVNGQAGVLSDDGLNFSLDLVASSEGEFDLSVVATDLAGNEATIATNIVIDTIAPTLSISAPSEDEVLSERSFTVSGTVNEQLSSVSINGEQGSLSEDGLSFSAETEASSDGSFEITVVGVDLAGNSATMSRSVLIDTVAPILTFSSPLDGDFISNSQVTISGSSSENLKELTLNGESISLSEDTLSFERSLSLSEGLFEVNLVGTDFAGNSSSQALSITIDTIAPVIELTGEENIYTNQESYQFTYNVTDSNSVENSLYLNGELQGTSTEKEGSVTLALNEGTNTISFQSKDAAGNTSSKELGQIILDQSAPSLTLEAPLEGEYFNELMVSVSGSSNEKLSSLSVNGETATLSEDGLSYSLDYSATKEGETSLELQAIDLAGNTVSLSRLIYIDITAPDITLSSSVGESTTETEALVSVEIVDDSSVSNSIYLNDTLLGQNELKTFSDTVSLSSGNEGVNLIRVSSIDAAGNESIKELNITYSSDSDDSDNSNDEEDGRDIASDDIPSLLSFF